MGNYLINEIIKYKTFYYRTLYCHKKMLKELKTIHDVDYDNYCNNDVIYTSNNLGKEINIDKSYQMMYVHLTHTDTTIFQQLILTRLISALEVFLIQNIKDVFLVNKKPFLNQTKFEVTESEILVTENIEEIQSKIINNLCRNVQSQGIKGIASLYKRIFSIDFESFNIKIDDSIYNYSYILMLHDMRHMIVHNLGKLDTKFKKQYDYQATTIKFSSNEFFIVFDILINFANYVYNNLESFKQPDFEISNSENIEYKINLIINDKKMYYIFQDSFTFKFKEQLYNFHTIKKSIKKTDNIIDLRIIGDRKIIGKYLSKIKKFEKDGLCTIQQLDSYRDFHESTKIAIK